mgnify:CR=1 FL=1
MTVRKIHLIAACGTGMGTLACMLKDKGYEVTGSDRDVYPPMSDFLKEKGIRLFEGYNERNLDYGPDLVIVGNAVKRDNCEAVRVMKDSVPYLSMPLAIVRFLVQDRKVILVSGTHGKTTTASIMAWLLHEAGMDPSFLIGGIVKNFGSSYRLGGGEYFVIEGDEYDTAFFDKGPKFMHYDPFITIVTGIEFDHADIFDDLDHVKQVFHKFFSKLSSESLLVVPTFDPNINEIIGAANCRLKKFGDKTGSVCQDQYEVGVGKARFQVSSSEYGKIPIETSLVGMHNMNNILCAACTLDEINCSADTLNKAMKTFSGIKRRQEVRGVKNGITVMDDFAHHPTAVRETVNAVKPFYKNGRVIAIFEPRTNTSMRKIFQEQYPRAFLNADMVCIKEPSAIEKIPEGERVCAKKIAEDIFNLGVNAYYFKRSDEIVDFMKKTAEKGDLLLVMSNGGFDDIHVKLLNALQAEEYKNNE